MATGNLLGGVVLQTLLLVLIDAVSGKKPLTFIAATPTILFQGIGLIALLSLVACVSILNEHLNLGFISAGSILLLGAFSVILRLSQQFEKQEPWKAVDSKTEDIKKNRGEKNVRRKHLEKKSLRWLVIHYVLGSFAILIGGISIAKCAQGIVAQTGLSATFVGATLLAISSSMPEFSTTFKAAKMGAYGMAISNIFGSNICGVTLLSFADVAYGHSSIYKFVIPANYLSIFVAVMGTSIYLMGLLERKDKSYLQLGYDSWLVLALTLPSYYFLWLLSS